VIATSYASGDSKTTSTVSLKGSRARIELGNDLVSVLQCDAGRTLQINGKMKTFLAVPFDAGTTAPRGDGKGGKIIYTTVVTDTGERQERFGFAARRLKTVITKEASAEACDRKPQTVETDGWYIPLPATVSCTMAPPPKRSLQVDPQRPDCVDEILYARDPAPVGYPVQYTTVSKIGDQAPVTTTMEATEVKRTDVPADGFDLPGDYVAVRTMAQLTADHRPDEVVEKKPGIVRLGVAPVALKTDAKVAADELSDHFTALLTSSTYDVVRLKGQTAKDVDADAKAKQCDFIVQSTLAELKVTGSGVRTKLAGSSGEGFTAKVDYAVVVPGQTKATFNGSERSGGGSTLAAAVAVAKKVAQFAPPLMMARYGFLNAYGSMLTSGDATGAMGQGSDPVMNTVFSLMSRPSSQKVDEYTSEEAAATAALEKAGQSVITELAKRKK